MCRCNPRSCHAFSFKLCTHILHETDSLSVWWEAFQLSNSLHTSYINMRSSYTIYVLCCCLDGIGHRFYSIFSPHMVADRWCVEARSLTHWADIERQTSVNISLYFFSFLCYVRHSMTCQGSNAYGCVHHRELCPLGAARLKINLVLQH